MNRLKQASIIAFAVLLVNTLGYGIVARAAETHPGVKSYNYNTQTWSCDCPATNNTCSCSY